MRELAMQWHNTTERYGLITKCLHWLIALIIISQIILGLLMGNVDKAIRGQFYFIHKSLGLTLLILALLFIICRLFNSKPKWPETMKIWEKFCAKIIHWLIYALILIMPLSGWIMSSAAGHPPSFWGLFTVKAPVAVDRNLAHFASNAHSFCAWTLICLLAIHIVAALKHHFINKDSVLKKMV